MKIKTLCYFVLSLLLCRTLPAAEWKPLKDSIVTEKGGVAEVEITGPGRGVSSQIGTPGRNFVRITFEAKGNTSIACSVFARRGSASGPRMALTDQWRRCEYTYYFLSKMAALQIRGAGKGRFSIRNFSIVPVELPPFSDVEVRGVELDLARGRNGRLLKIGGETARRGGRYSRLLRFAPVRTTRPLYLFLETRTEGSGRQTVSLWRDRQKLTETPCGENGQRQWVKLGPLPAEALYPESEVVLGGGKEVSVAVFRAVLTTDPAWNAGKGAEKQPPPTGLVAGKGTTGVNAGPFVRIKENRFAADQSSVKLTYDVKCLRAEFFCREKALDPAANRLHEFKTQEKQMSKNDYVILLLLRDGKMYAFIVSGAGKIEDSIGAGPDFWQNRDKAWNSGAEAETQTGNGFWKAVVRIPWASVGGVPRGGEIIRFQAGRKANPGKELSVLFPTASGFHQPADFGALSFAKKVPEITVTLPKFLPGVNAIATDGAAIQGKIEFPGVPPVLCGEKFDLNRPGKFLFSLKLLDPLRGLSVFSSPVYQLSATAELISFDETNSVMLNGRKIRSGTVLSDGFNRMEVSMPFKGSILVGNSKVTPPAARFTLAVNTSLLWPNWQAKELTVIRGGIQMLLFSPNGFPGLSPDDYRLKLDLPPGFVLECVSGYYQNYKLTWTPDGEIRFLNALPYSKVLPPHKFIAAFIRIPQDFADPRAQLAFAAGSRKNNVVEVPQRVSLRLLPPCRGGRPKTLFVSMSSGWLKRLSDRKYLDTYIEYLTTVGVNAMSHIPSKRIRYGYVFNFKDWSWPLEPYIRKHPSAALTMKDGRRNPRLICPEHMRRPEFSAWIESQIPLWLKRAGDPAYISWDYEYDISSGPFSCYCSACSRKTDVVSRNRNMADFAKMIRTALKARAPRILFCIYSGYQSEKSKHAYGMDWRMVRDTVDFAICGYGRPAKELQTMLGIMGEKPLVLGALVTPYDTRSRVYPEPLTAARLLRRAVDSTGGILIYELSSLDGYSLSACAEVSRIMEKYEDFIRFGKRLNHPLPGWTEEDIQVIEHTDRKVLFLMNSSGKARTYRGKAVLPGKVLVEELPRR